MKNSVSILLIRLWMLPMSYGLVEEILMTGLTRNSVISFLFIPAIRKPITFYFDYSGSKKENEEIELVPVGILISYRAKKECLNTLYLKKKKNV